MGPWRAKIFEETPKWVQDNLLLERSRCGATNSKTAEWDLEMMVSKRPVSSFEFNIYVHTILFYFERKVNGQFG